MVPKKGIFVMILSLNLEFKMVKSLSKKTYLIVFQHLNLLRCCLDFQDSCLDLPHYFV